MATGVTSSVMTEPNLKASACSRDRKGSKAKYRAKRQAAKIKKGEKMAEYYNLIKYFHYLCFISWMAFLFYQPRLYVYHAENMDKPDFVRVVEVQEYKMYHYIGWVALIGTFLTGILIIVAMPELLRSGYMHVKLTVVVILAAFHLDLGRYMVQLREKRCKKSGMFFRAYNEVPTIAMVIIIWMMVYKPF